MGNNVELRAEDKQNVKYDEGSDDSNDKGGHGNDKRGDGNNDAKTWRRKEDDDRRRIGKNIKEGDQEETVKEPSKDLGKMHSSKWKSMKMKVRKEFQKRMSEKSQKRSYSIQWWMIRGQ